MGIGALWSLIATQPMVNVLIGLSRYVFGSFGLAIIVLTIIIRVCMYPLTAKQLRSSRAMQELQPKIAELQKKYAKDKKRLGEEQMKLYKQSGVSPAGCAVPMLIQMPIWIALYQSVIKALAVIPEDFLALSHYLYSWPIVYSVLPLNNNFLWFNLVSPNIPLAIIVGATMWLTQKMVTPATTDPQQRSQSQMMLWMMPLMFGFLAMNLPSGLVLYWVASNVISIVMQYLVLGGWGGLARSGAGKYVVRSSKDIKIRVAEAETTPSSIPAMEADIVETSPAREEGSGYGVSGDKRQLGRGGYPTSLKAIRRQSRRSKGQRPKRR